MIWLCLRYGLVLLYALWGFPWFGGLLQELFRGEFSLHRLNLGVIVDC